MNRFMDQNFLLSNSTARELYHTVASAMPIVDYHCHVSPKDIYEDRRFENITRVWLSGDHYKWRIMRSDGVDEYYITGGASDREKFQKFAEALPKAAGNPMYHWCHLELQRYFGYKGILNGETAQQVWDLTCERLKDEGMGVRGLISRSNVVFIGTTDDPSDSLEWHKRLASDETINTVVSPSFRPDKALNIDTHGWKDYIASLSSAAGLSVDGWDTLKQALKIRMNYFNAFGCRASDHGLERMVFRPGDKATVDGIIKKGLAGTPVTVQESEIFKTELLLFCAGEYARLGWVMQIHYNCLRNPNTAMFTALGPDAGFDCIGPDNGGRALAKFLDTLNSAGALPRTVLYSLDAGDNGFLDTLIGAFQTGEIPGKLQHGSAWWFNDSKQGMRDHLISLASLGLLGNFIGMLTDSRSFLSYARHEYFRRILCSLIGEWVENGEYPADKKGLHKIVRDICYNNAMHYFRLEE